MNDKRNSVNLSSHEDADFVLANEDYLKRLSDWERARYAPPPAPPMKSVEPTRTVMMPMRDGVHLYTEIFLPSEFNSMKTDSYYPVILARSPYPYTRASRVSGDNVRRYLDAGYAFVFQLTRGQGQSEGHFRYLSDDIDDGYDSVQWIAKQNWCDGNVGMSGSSYLGSSQLMAARAKPPALKCIMPTAFVGNFTRCFPFSCGVPKRGPSMQWYQLLDVERLDELDVAYYDENIVNHSKWGPAIRKRPLLSGADELLCGEKLDSWKEIISHPLDNEFWQDVHFSDEDLKNLDLPIFFTDGWYDLTIGPIDYFSRLEKLQPKRSDRYLLVGPWDHNQVAGPNKPGDKSGGRILPKNAITDHVAYRIAFFDRYLKGDKNVRVQQEKVRVFITGPEDSKANIWKTFPSFPVPGTQLTSLFLHSNGDARSFPGDGKLISTPARKQVIDSYVYNPALPTNFKMESYNDRRDIEIRSDVLTYTSAPFTQPITILGEIRLVLFAASDAPDTDWFAAVTEVFPNGMSRSFHYAPPAFRARYREGMDREVFLTPNKPEEFRMSLGPAGHQIGVGNRLRLSIFSSAFPEHDPNTNTGNPAATDVGMRVALQKIFHGTTMPSRIELPLIEL